MRKHRSIYVAAAAATASVTLLQTVGFAQTTQPVGYNDILTAMNRPNPANATAHYRGNPSVLNNGTLVGSTWSASFVQSIEFDNTDGLRHNYTGNMLGLDFGTLSTGGGVLYNMATMRTPNDTNPGASERIFNIRDYNNNTGSFVLESRLSAISVSPLNNRIAVAGNDSGEVYVADYSNGATPGVGSGASVSNVREGSNLVVGGSQTHGVTWLDNNDVLALGHDGSVHKLAVGPSSLTDSTVANISLPGGRNYFSSMLYEPTLSPNVYVMISDFTSSVSTNRLVVLDPTNNFAQVGSFDYSASSNTSREIAFDVNGNLLIGQFASPIGAPLIDVVPHGNILANLANNNSQDFATVTAATGTASFNGLDVASTLLDYKTAGLTKNIRTKSLVVRYFPGQIADPTTTIRQQLFTGRNGGAWNGTGLAIISSDAAADPNHNKGIGYAQASELGLVGGTFAGVSVDGDAVLMKYTYNGDANMNGKVDGGDYSRIDSNFNIEHTAGNITGWYNGDFDYNGKIDGTDYSMIDSAFNSQSGTLARVLAFLDGSDTARYDMTTPALARVVQDFDQFGQSYANAFITGVPEPTSMIAAGLIGATFLGRRRRRMA